MSCITVSRLGQSQCQDVGATSRHAHALIHTGRGRARRSLSASRACGDRVHRLEVSSLTSDTRRVADITPTVFLPFLMLDAFPSMPLTDAQAAVQAGEAVLAL